MLLGHFRKNTVSMVASDKIINSHLKIILLIKLQKVIPNNYDFVRNK